MFDFLTKLFGVQLPPILSENEISDFGKVSVSVGWFIRRDRAVNTFIGKASIIFRNGIFPSFWDKTSLREILSQYSDLKEWPIGDWLVARIFNVLNFSDMIMRDHFRNFLDMLSEMNIKSTDKLWKIGQQYHLRSNNIIFEPEVEKITDQQDKIDFLQELIDTYCIGAETRILNWLYQKYFGEEYKPIRLKIEDVLRKWNENSTEKVYWDLMISGASEDAVKRMMGDPDLLDKYFQLRHKGIPVIQIAVNLKDLVANRNLSIS